MVQFVVRANWMRGFSLMMRTVCLVQGACQEVL